ncbi:UDP-N-acetylmuramoyl-tripeptide--D-alanyl-D-alanine ligase [Blattabacterium sp. (Blaberus giganteus)]|uniref:UDP-N-acetylmuramoyl-tripeptide--D-alanyl-D- alanine ligase n=1 Tax=Blattabacterium sp. (Blaberus giganteus) TaxID=1186051 RepID=UPI00025F7015|nr:UDP-N-acetylmuramoyl-tripeptide--D-alanyl-D-alanine ligase [Blattabacterium sp. (Blaberus giganteus)]AFJ90954.1 UDP-N-acetylmuramoyl-tripeptide-D-alanyl-D- alanine ligase [Blattabacterium sp. (Blaberus giganteus)]
MNIQNIYQLYSISSGIEINSKKVKKGSIFVALKGKNFDGNQFAYEAILNGALLSIVDNKKYVFCKKIIYVYNTLYFLHELAIYHRYRFHHIPIIAITGSNGKTTTKELTTAILSKKYKKKVHCTKNNLNNHIGVPLTILSMPMDTKICVMEIGANHEKEIEKMCDIIRPDYGYISNFGKAHLEGFKNIEGIIRSKLELYDFLKKNKKIVFINGDDPIQLSNSTGMNRYIFSEKHKKKKSDINIKYLWEKNSLKSTLYIKNIKIVSPLIGNYNLYNIASAITIGTYFKVPLKKIKEAVEEYVPSNYRSQILKKNNIKIIIDCYNANPTSMIEALTFLNNIEGVKIVILGDMLELGLFSNDEHEKIISFIKKSNINIAFLIGNIFFNTKKTSYKIKKFINKNKFFECIKKYSIQKTDYILIKGSRKMALESIIDLI